jgi:hypothetical protein
VLHLRALLMVLIVLRLLMPPGICACKWTSPAARFLVALLHSNRTIPTQDDRDDDHAPGCPASPLAVGMGVKPPSEPLLPPTVSLDPTPLLESAQSPPSMPAMAALPLVFTSPPDPLYLTLRSLLI